MQNERLTSRTPSLLTVAVILLLALRLVVWFIETYKTPPPDGIKWQEPSQADLAGVRDYQPKPVLYYFCEANSETCRRVEQNALLDKNLVKVINDDFLPIMVLNKSGAILSKELQERFGVLMYPAFVVALPSGKEIGSQAACFGVSAKNLLSFIQHCKRQEKYVAGLDYLTHAQYEQAAQAFQIWLPKNDKSDQQTLDGALYCALAQQMLFRENAAQRILATVRYGQYRKDSSWPQPLVQFLLGRLSAQDLLQRCDHQQSRQAQALYFVGMLELRNGAVQNAVNDFRQVDKFNEVSPEIRSLINGQIKIISEHSN